MRLLLLICVMLFASNCSPKMNFERDKNAFDNAALLRQYRAIADMNDYYFEMKENGFFEFYRQLFDSVKNSSYPGKYIQQGDTLYLSYYNTKALDLLGDKAWVNPAKREIVFLNDGNRRKKRLIFN